MRIERPASLCLSVAIFDLNKANVAVSCVIFPKKIGLYVPKILSHQNVAKTVFQMLWQLSFDITRHILHFIEVVYCTIL